MVLYQLLFDSLYNLIPSCTRCNTNVKGARQQSQTLHIHPYVDSLRDYIRFYVVLRFLPFGRLPEDEDVSVAVRERFPVRDKAKVQRALQSSEFFHLEDVYNQVYIKIVGDAVRRAFAFSTGYREDMEAKYPGINRNIIDRMLFGAVICPGDENYYPFAVAIGDINEQLHVRRMLISCG